MVSQQLLEKCTHAQLQYESANNVYVIQLSDVYCAKMLWVNILTNTARIMVETPKGVHCRMTFSTYNSQCLSALVQARLGLGHKVLSL